MILNTKSGPFYFLISVIFFSVMEILVKFLSSSYPIGELVFFRGFFGLLPIIFIMPKKKFFQNFKTKKIKLHIFRTITGCFALISIFFGLKYLPLADAISITFAAPIFATIFSIFFLKAPTIAQSDCAQGCVFNKNSGLNGELSGRKKKRIPVQAAKVSKMRSSNIYI